MNCHENRCNFGKDSYIWPYICEFVDLFALHPLTKRFLIYFHHPIVQLKRFPFQILKWKKVLNWRIFSKTNDRNQKTPCIPPAQRLGHNIYWKLCLVEIAAWIMIKLGRNEYFSSFWSQSMLQNFLFFCFRINAPKVGLLFKVTPPHQ